MAMLSWVCHYCILGNWFVYRFLWYRPPKFVTNNII